MRSIMLVGLLCSCTLPPPVRPAEELELNRIEEVCLLATAEGRQMPGWDCGFGGLEDARMWEAEYRRPR